jgi:aromatic ring-opening dioxygenase catalytic subunit (LigB family)
MGTIAGAMATSHAFALIEPKLWDEMRERNRASYLRRYGHEAPIQPELAGETLADNERRYANLAAAYDQLRRQIAETRPDVLIVIGDDQNENLSADNMPQLALYTGAEFMLNRRTNRTNRTNRFRTHREITNALLARGIDEGFDFASLGSFKEDELLSHAHWQLLDLLLPDGDIPVVLLFLNAIHYPAITPRRCYAVGELIRRVIQDRPAGEKALLCGSGGLSHFTAGFPWRHYQGPFAYGAISEAFDRTLLRHIEAGEGHILAQLSSDELLAHGDIEFRAWIAVLGALGAQPSRFTVYEPFYRAIGGMGVASWPAVG